MPTNMNMVYWKGEKYWVGKLLDHPEIMAQGETIEELEANLREAYLLMVMDGVPEEHSIKPIPMLSVKLSVIAASPSEESRTVDESQEPETTIPRGAPSELLQNETIAEEHLRGAKGGDGGNAATEEYCEYFFSTKGVCAYGCRYPDGGFTVLKGSTAVGETGLEDSFPEYAKMQRLFLTEKGILVANDQDKLIFAKDEYFSDLSAPACIVAGNSRNGNDAWIKYMVCWRHEGAWQGKLLKRDCQDSGETLNELAGKLWRAFEGSSITTPQGDDIS